MDPLTAIGLVSNILSFIDFSVQLLKGAKEVYDSQHGVLEENRNRETLVREMQRMSTQMLVSGSSGKADDDSTLAILARECCELSAQLISLLEKIKPSDSGSKTQSFMSAIRNKVYDSDREDLEARLNNCRTQLHLELSHLARTEMLEKLEKLIQASKSDETKLDRIESHIAQLREHINSASYASEAKPMLMKILAEEEKVFTAIARDRILKCISFEGMNRRSNMVVETHSNTYEWILEDDPEAEEPSSEHEGDNVVEFDGSNKPEKIEDVEKLRAREKLRTWLESASSRDVFHLSGKLGSGKSTLMKHIRASPRTEEKLKKWADGRELTIANFYFWNIGSDYEKSLQGLYTSLLYQIFSQCPDFISKVWPSHWAQANSAPWLVSKAIEVSAKDVMQAFNRVIDSHDVLKGHCFAFFIDGLDEFQSTVRDDHRDLVKLLCRWAASPTGNIKICVSSREYPVFMDGFKPTLRIRFHDLTRRDMDTYIRDKLAHASTEEGFESLVSLIMNKADGIFLWVALVVKSLREGLETGMSCSDLKQEVDVLPEQLESLYKHILASLGKLARRKAYQTFAMVMELKKHENYRMSLLAYSFFEEYEAGESFFMNGDNYFPMARLTGQCGKERAESSSRRLAGWCKGLVELYTKPVLSNGPPGEGPCIAAWEGWSKELDFAHRSIQDFLESEEVKSEMKVNLRRFDPVDAILNLMVSDVLYENAISTYNTSRSGITTAVLVEIMDTHNMIREPYTYLNRVRDLMAAGNSREPMSSNTSLLLALSHDDGRFGFALVIECLGQPESYAKLSDETLSEDKNVPRYCYISDPLHRMVLLGLCDYPLWHIANSFGNPYPRDTLLTLACICFDESHGMEGPLVDNHQNLRVLEALFERGWLTPDSITNYVVSRFGSLSSDKSQNYSYLTLWHRLLVKALNVQYFPIHHLATDEQVRRRAQHDGKLFQLFLRFKTDTEFSFTICVNEETTAVSRDFLLNLGTQGLLKLTTLTPDYQNSDEWRQPWKESDVGLPSENGTPATRHFSLREFIELSLYDNKAELLQMLDEQSKPKLDVQAGKSTATAAGTQTDDYSHEERILEENEFQDGKTSRGPDPEMVSNADLQNFLEDASRWFKHSSTNEYVRYGIAVSTDDLASSPSSLIHPNMGAKIDALSHASDFCISITAFGVFIFAYIGNYRQKLWYKGGAEGWNSSPNERIHCDIPGHCHELPEPLVWSQQLTEATLAIALLSLSLFVTRIVLGLSWQMSRIISIFYDSLLAFFWFRILLSQASGDFSDPRYPSPWPWYLVRKCPTDTAAACYVAQTGFVVSVIAALFYGGRFVAAAIEVAAVWIKDQETGFKLVATNPDFVDEENGLCLEDAIAREKERYRYLYEEALSPVLAFFPEDSR